MKKLRFEIYNTLVGKQSVQDFEQFLYSNQMILDNLDNNAFYYTIVTINYRSSDCLHMLEKEAFLQYGEDFKKVVTVEKSCVEITQQTSLDVYCEILKNILIDFVHEEDPNLFWGFYEFYDRVDLILCGYCYEEHGMYQKEIQDFAEKILNQMQNLTSYSAKKTFVFQKTSL